MSFLLGLTGSIGMGKSTTAQMFADEGCAVWDSDAAVHRLYAPGGKAVEPIEHLYPDAVKDGQVSRDALKTVIARDASALKEIERIVHPLVAAEQQDFIESTDADIIVLDVPLLFETGKDKTVDAVVVVTVDPAEQKRRLAERGTMTAEHLETIRQQQLSDAEKRARADFIVQTDTLGHARAQVEAIVTRIREGLEYA